MLPHDKVYTRLGVSSIHGIGVFAICNIEKNTLLFEQDNTEMIWIDAKDTIGISDKLKKMYDDFCVIKDDGTKYGCPANFNQLTMGWYMNHSDTPNVEIDENYDFRTNRDIEDGEELTINYKTFSE